MQRLEDLPQPTQKETAQTPRQRIEVSFQERQEIINAYNSQISNEWENVGEWLDPRTRKKITYLEKQCNQKLRDQKLEFRKLVSNLPEAEEWEKIERERWLGPTAKNKSLLTREPTSADEAYVRLLVNIMGQKEYIEAWENLKQVRERTASATNTKTASK